MLLCCRRLSRDWRYQLGDLIRGSDDEILIATPYISKDGVDFHFLHEK